MGCWGGIGAAILPESTLVLSARMPLDDYFVGVLFFASIWGAAGLVAWTLVRRRLPRRAGGAGVRRALPGRADPLSPHPRRARSAVAGVGARHGGPGGSPVPPRAAAAAAGGAVRPAPGG